MSSASAASRSSEKRTPCASPGVPPAAAAPRDALLAERGRLEAPAQLAEVADRLAVALAGDAEDPVHLAGVVVVERGGAGVEQQRGARDRLLRAVVEQQREPAALGLLGLGQLVREPGALALAALRLVLRRPSRAYSRAFCAARAAKSASTRSCASSAGEKARRRAVLALLADDDQHADQLVVRGERRGVGDAAAERAPMTAIAARSGSVTSRPCRSLRCARAQHAVGHRDQQHRVGRRRAGGSPRAAACMSTRSPSSESASPPRTATSRSRPLACASSSDDSSRSKARARSTRVRSRPRTMVTAAGVLERDGEHEDGPGRHRRERGPVAATR